MSSADSHNGKDHVHPDRLLPLGEMSPRQQAVSDLLRWGVDVQELLRGGATDSGLVELHDNMARLAVKYNIDLEECAKK